MSCAALGRALRLSGWQAARICRGQSPELSVVRLSQLCAVVGLDLAARSFPGALPVRDAGHGKLLRRVRARLGPTLAWSLEVPVVEMRVSGSLDRRAWDATIGGPGWLLGVEAETRVRDVQALLRRIELKVRDGRVDGVLLVLSDTTNHRQLMREHESLLRDTFPGSPRQALRALRNGTLPPLRTALLL